MNFLIICNLKQFFLYLAFSFNKYILVALFCFYVKNNAKHVYIPCFRLLLELLRKIFLGGYGETQTKI
jgi:hypothetical protein